MTGSGQLPITVDAVVLSRKELKVVWTPWPALNVVRLCFSLLIQTAPMFFWVTAALLQLPKQPFLVMIMVGLVYNFLYLGLNRIAVMLSKASVLLTQPVDWFIDAAGVRRKSIMFEFYIKREAFVSFAEDKKRFLFLTSSRNVIVLPKRCLNEDQASSLRTLIATWRELQRLPKRAA